MLSTRLMRSAAIGVFVLAGRSADHALAEQGKTKIVLIAGRQSHGYGAHEHNAGCVLLGKCLEEGMPNVRAVVHRNGWPSDPKALDGAAAIVIFCDGGGGHVIMPHLAEVDALMKKGVGLACLHYAVIVDKGKPGDYFLDWLGGYYELWWSVNPHWKATFDRLPDHPITRGVRPFSIDDEWYYHMRFRPNMQGVTPVLTATPPNATRQRPDGPHSGNKHVRARMGMPEHPAWACERPDGGRGFGFTGGHWHVSWAHDDFRKLILNAIVWVARLEVPKDGVSTKTPSVEEIEAGQDEPKPKDYDRAKLERQIREWNGPKASTRREIETDWARQDACRLAEIREPGLVRFVETELQWPGVRPDDRLRIPKAAASKLDGALDDPGWTQAAVVEREGPNRPDVSFVHDNERLYVGISMPTGAEVAYRGDPTALDASGAVDGVKNGRYAFHTGHEPNPWWQVDLGESRPIGKIIVYNRLDYAPGLHNADNLRILTSNDERQWTLRHDNKGKHFGGVTGAKPLVVEFAPGAAGEPSVVRARFVRLQIPSGQPIFFHLDEVEVYPPGEAKTNIALRRPARQSSLSIWSRGGLHRGGLLTIDSVKVGLTPRDPVRVSINGAPAPDSQARLRREGGQTRIELALPLSSFAGGFPSQCQPPEGPAIGLAAGGSWRLALSEVGALGFGKNVATIELNGQSRFDPPIELTAESIVFTPQRPERKVCLQRQVAEPQRVQVAFQIADEGPAAVVVTARQGKVVLREGRTFFVEPVERTLARADQIIADGSSPTKGDIASLREQVQGLVGKEAEVGPDPGLRQPLYRQARWLARGIAFDNLRRAADKLVFVKRFTQETYPDVCLNHMPWTSRPGGDICVLTLGACDEAPAVRNVLNGALGPGHVHGMDLSWDATRVVLGYAKARSGEPPKGWRDRRTNFDLRRDEEPIHIFEVGIDGKGVRQLTRGEWSDLDPTYLPNGDIAFVSERCGCSLQCNEYDKDETSCNIYVMRPDGSDIRHMSVSKDGDYLPHALDDGTIAYTRWEYQERGWAHIQSIWAIRPDGTFADAVFKQHLNEPWGLEDIRSIPGGRKLVAVAAGHHTLQAGPVVIVDAARGLNNVDGIGIVTPGVLPPEGGMAGRAVPEGGVTGAGGFYMMPWPVSETTFLASYCYGSQTDPTGYALYLIDVYGTKELVYDDPAISCFVPIPLRPRTRPPVMTDTRDAKSDRAVLAAINVGYGVDGVAPGRIRYIRISKRDQWPYCNTYGGQRYEPDVKSVMVNWTPARVIGTVPVEADGSAHFEVPADTPVYFQLLDENHMELRRMRSFISLQPGETRGCFGCHETRAEAPPTCAAPLALRGAPRVPMPPPWGERAISFLRDVQPVFDKHCVRCHAGMKPAGGLDFSGGLTKRYNRAYDTILTHGLVARSNVGDDAKITPPLAFGSHKSKLVAVLQGDKHRDKARLSRTDWLRLVTWIDANGPYHDGFINKRRAEPAYDLPTDGKLIEQIAAVHTRRCAACHQPSDVTRPDWIDVRAPSRSLFLTAPLSREAGGAGRCKGLVYKDRADADYQAVVGMVQAAVEKAWQHPRRDLMALLPEQPGATPVPAAPAARLSREASDDGVRAGEGMARGAGGL
ncbi:MAG: ThuA domain-containing protein [Phycisphaerae bacterium]|nr:ThuA domain-containing protein [Phycisphaerae bacterium]